jgi:hypothetical protein
MGRLAGGDYKVVIQSKLREYAALWSPSNWCVSGLYMSDQARSHSKKGMANNTV